MSLDCLKFTPGEIVAEVAKLVTAENAAEAARAVIHQRRIARELGTHRKSIEGLGAPTLELDSWVATYWKRREGAGVFSDRVWRRYMRAHAPEVFVRDVQGTRMQMGWTPPDRKRVKVKSYPTRN